MKELKTSLHEYRMTSMNLSDLVAYIRNREFSLFIGSGASVPGGGPTGSQLLDEVQRKYSGTKEKDFFATFDIILKEEKERAAVEDFLRALLASITPNVEHRYLFSLPWRAVATTNYDRIPDLIDTTLDGNRTIETLIGLEPRVDIRREDHLYCFKLFGDVSFSYPQQGHMVLKNADRRRAYTRQANFFSLFRDLAKSGIVVYIGYSFEDELVFDILEDLLFEAKTFPHRGFAIIPKKPSEKVLQKLRKCNIEWIEGTLEKSVVEFKKVFGEIPKSCSISTHPIKVHGKMIELDRTTFSNVRGKLKVVHQGLYQSECEDAKLFLEGKDQSFVPFQKGWDFPRRWRLEYHNDRAPPANLENVETLVESRSRRGNPADNLIYALTGTAGSGKSIVARKIAHEWYTHENPVLFLDTTNVFLDTTAIEALLDEIWNKYRRQLRKDENVEEIRYLAICDNGSLILSQIKQLADQLTSAGKPVDILVVDRSSELSTDTLKDIGTDAILTLTDTITPEESRKFVEHFDNLKVLPDLSALSYNLTNPEINTSFFALLYTSIREVQASLRDIVIKEFESKPPEIKRLYSLVSLIQSFGLTPYHTIATKTGILDFDQIATMIRSGPLRGVLNFNDEEKSIEANHRIIADIIRKHVFSTNDLLVRALSNVISVTTEGNIAEMTLVHKMLIDCAEIRSQLADDQLEELFDNAIKRMKTRPLLLHLARTQLRRKRYPDCRISLDQARRTQHPSFPEALHHVFDVEGRLELSMGRETMSTDEETAWSHFEKAEGAFIQARIDPIATPHPYLGLSQTYAEMARLQKDRESAINILLLSLNVLQELKNNSPEWFTLSRPLELERSIFTHISGLGFGEADAAAVFERSHNANGYAFLAETKIEAGDDKEALRLVDEGLKRDKQSVWLIRTRVSLLKKLFPEDLDEMYDTLMQYQKGSSFDLQLAFELAKLQFIKQEWALSNVTFGELRQKSRGYRNRLIPSPRDRWFEKGKPKKLSGIIVKPPTVEEWGELRSNDPPIPSLIRVEHRFIKYERYVRRDKVWFEIVFNMTGPQASEVTQR